MTGVALTLAVTVAATIATLVVALVRNGGLRVEVKELEIALEIERSARSKAIGEIEQTRNRLEAIIASRDLEISSIYEELSKADNQETRGRIAVRGIRDMLHARAPTHLDPDDR